MENTLQIIEIFLSVQGETSWAGLPTTFVRLAACNLRCTWCDTTYSFGRGETYSIEKILHRVEDQRARVVCITGGEPLLQKNVYLLMKELCDRGFQVTLETSGSISTSLVDSRVHVILDVKCPGSGMSEKNLWVNLNHLRLTDEVKFVIKNREDYLYSKEICQKYDLFNKVNNVLFSPVFAELESRQLVEWLLDDHLPVRLNLQLHKFIWDPATKGV